jgi:hypothetical protein
MVEKKFVISTESSAENLYVYTQNLSKKGKPLVGPVSIILKALAPDFLCFEMSAP